MQTVVTGRFQDFAAAARGASALVADGFAHGEVSLIARSARPRWRPALMAGAVGAVVAPGSVLAWSADAGALIALAPAAGAAVGAVLAGVSAWLAERRASRRAEEVRVVVDPARAARAGAILRATGATLRLAPHNT
jgi:hypothetical protein